MSISNVPSCLNSFISSLTAIWYFIHWTTSRRDWSVCSVLFHLYCSLWFTWYLLILCFWLLGSGFIFLPSGVTVAEGSSNNSCNSHNYDNSTSNTSYNRSNCTAIPTIFSYSYSVWKGQRLIVHCSLGNCVF